MRGWYAMRFWIENGFRQLKRGAWQWHNTKMTERSLSRLPSCRIIVRMGVGVSRSGR